MGRLFSPWAPSIRAVELVLPALVGIVRPTGRSTSRVVRQALLLLLSLAISAGCFSSVSAQTSTQVELETFSGLNKGLIIVAFAVVFLQALLIFRLLVTQRRRRRAEIESRRLDALARSEQKRLAEVVSDVPGMVWESRLDPGSATWTATFISDYAERMTGYTVQEWLSTPGLGLKIVHEDDREMVTRGVQEVFAGAGASVLRFRWIAKNGSIVWAEAHVAPLLDDTGTIVGIRGVTLDITEQQAAEEARRRGDEKFAKAFRLNPQPMTLTTVAEGRYIDVNESFLEISGYKREEVIGHTALDLCIWQTPEHRVNFIKLLKQQGSIVNVETKLRAKDGSMKVFLSSAEELELSGEKCLLISSSDITERVNAQLALRESEERFRNMADVAPVMIWILGADKKSTYFNKQWLDFTGRPIDKELGDGWAEGIHPEDYNRALQICSQSFEERKQFELEFRIRRKDGEYRWIYDTGTPLFSPDHVFLGYIGSAIDITERKESEVELHQANKQLQELKNQLEAENIYLQQELQLDPTIGEIVGQSDGIKYVLFKITQVAPTDTTVLITGETGTGKELVARAIHSSSSRKDRPLIKVNCGALAPSLIESELFGHEKGSFTGAITRKLGRFELANGGTIFLDEIGELPLELQVKLLRVIQENEFERLGGTKTIKVDVRIIAATNRNLKQEVDNGRFREDLWYRLNVYPITVPPLRQRREDIPLLIEHFANGYAKKFGKHITSVSPRALQTLQSHSWPGNVRELANAIERAVIHAKGSVLHSVGRFEEPSEEPPFLAKTLEEVEREYILRTLENTGWRIEGPNGAANILGLNPSTLRTRMVKLGIQRRATAGQNSV